MSGTGQLRSVWMATAGMPAAVPLPDDADADVCIIGGGIAGLTTAYRLVCEGLSVIVLDDGPLGGGETSRTTAHLSNAIDDRYAEIERLHDTEGARLAADSHTAAIDWIERTVHREHIACDFERLDGFLILSPNQAPDVLDREYEAAQRAGLAVERLAHAPLSTFSRPCLRFPRQGQLHPLKYLAGLAEGIRRRGGRLYTDTHVTAIAGGSPGHVETASGRVVRADAVVVATNTPVNDRLTIHLKQAAYRTYVLAARIAPGSIPKGLYWDTEDPYHYVRLQPFSGSELLIIGGEDHKTGQAADGRERHERLAL